jgi:hypothetical protein
MDGYHRHIHDRWPSHRDDRPTTFSGTSGTNILFNQFDINANASTDPNAPTLLFGLIDNILVEQIPEPSAMIGIGVGLAAVLSYRRRSSTTRATDRMPRGLSTRVA